MLHNSFTCVIKLMRKCDITHLYVWYDSVICVKQLIHMCAIIHSYVGHDAFICVTRPFQTKPKTHYMTHSHVGRDSCTWGDMTHSYVWHDSYNQNEETCLSPKRPIQMCVWRDFFDMISFICVIWLIHMCDMTHSYVRHDAFICVTWLIHTCDMTHS